MQHNANRRLSSVFKSVPIIYTSNDGSLSCRLTSYTPTGDIEEVGSSEGGMLNYSLEDLFEIDSLNGKDTLLEIIKEQHIAEDFPIKCKTGNEVMEILKKLLDSKSS